VATSGGVSPLKKKRKSASESFEKRISALEQRVEDMDKEKERWLVSPAPVAAAEMRETHQEKSKVICDEGRIDINYACHGWCNYCLSDRSLLREKRIHRNIYPPSPPFPLSFPSL
jgi:hypothetical protein